MAYGSLPTNWDSLNDSQKNSAAIGAGYTGLNDYNDQRNRGLSSPGGSTPAGAGANVAGLFTPAKSPAIDLPALYKTLYDNSGITKSQQQIDEILGRVNDQTAAKNAAVAGVNDNPFYSEATRVGRASKIEQSANADIATLQNKAVPLQNKIAVAKQDIEQQLNLQKSQHDINSQESQLALQRYSTLLSDGSLDNASGQDIAAIASSTGLSTGMIQSAIDANKVKNNPVQFVSFDDGTNTGYAVVDSQGNIIKKQIVAGSKPTATEEKLAAGGGTGGTSSAAQIKADKAAAPAQAIQDAQSRMTLGTMMNLYQKYGMTPQQVYDIYIRNAPADYHANSPEAIKHDTALYHVKHN